jgi:hypothetical protein
MDVKENLQHFDDALSLSCLGTCISIKGGGVKPAI